MSSALVPAGVLPEVRERPMSDAILLIFDDRFADYARACINSIAINYPHHPPLLVRYAGQDKAMHGFLDAHDARRFDWPDQTPASLARLPAGPVGNPIVYDRIRLWSELFPEIEQLLLLDADTLVLRPLDTLFRRRGFFAVSNHEPGRYVRVFHPELADDAVLARKLREDGIHYPAHMDDMLNAGVMVLPRELRSGQTREEMAYLAGRYGEYLNYADQSLISLWSHYRNLPISRDYAFNFQSPFFSDAEIDIDFDDIAVLHFSSHRKPGTQAFMEWERVAGTQERCLSLFHAYRDAGIDGETRPVAIPQAT